MAKFKWLFPANDANEMKGANGSKNNATVRVREFFRGSAPRVRPPKAGDSRKPPGAKPAPKSE